MMFRIVSNWSKPVMAMVLSSVIASVASSAFAQAPSEWTHLTSTPADKVGAERWAQPLRGELFRLDTASLRGKLGTAARGEPFSATDLKTLGQVIQLPMPDGTFARFSIIEAPVMEDGLAAQFPEIKTYAGQGIDDSAATVRLDITPAGFHAQILSPNGAVYVDPAYRGDANLHVSYYKRDLVKPSDGWECPVEGGTVANKAGSETSSEVANKVQSGATLRTFRLAVAADGEYTAFHSPAGTTNAASGQAAIVTAVNRVDGVYETELAVRLVLISSNSILVYTNVDTDPYNNTNSSLLLSQNQSNLDAVIGSGAYDIGHVFTTGGGGLAGLGVVCASNFKARGETGLSAPIGDGYYIDYVAHEMGHQFGANHTFNSTNFNCGVPNRNAATAMEPGSGSTIMAYAGICPPDDLQPHSDPYFHGVSLDEIQTFLSAGGGCAVPTATGNTAPTVSVLGPTNYTIPASTPFVLTATGSDAENDPLSYCWEEMDAGAPAPNLTSPDNGSMALFRTFLPTNVAFRFFPKLSSILANTNWNQEKLPTTSRTMKFRVTARDNHSGGGGVSDAQMQVSSVAGTGPFVVTSPNTSVTWSNTQTVTWNVAGSATAPISATGVNIYLSTNGGLTFPFLLATNVPNNGSASVLLPNLASSQARIMVQGAGNIFFDISDTDFSITPAAAGIPFVQLTGTSLVSESCTPTNGAIDPYETVTMNWVLSNTGGAPTTNLVATLLTSNGVYYPSAPQNLGAIPASGAVTQAFSFTAAGVCGGSVSPLVKLTDGTADMGTVGQTLPLGIVQSSVVTQVFANASTVIIPTTSNGPATPYPSTILVSGVVSPVTKVTVNLPAMWHTYIADVGMLLVGPGGQNVILMDTCGNYNPPGTVLAGANLTFDDSATNFLPFGPTSASDFSSGTYKPTALDYPGGDYDPPAPTSVTPYGTNLNALAVSPNGTWSLYVDDFAGGDGGALTNGWSINFISSSATTNCCSTFPAPTLTSTTYSNSVVLFNWSAIPGPHYQVLYSTNLATGPWQNLGSPILATNTTMGIIDSVGSSPMRFYRVLVEP